MMAESRTLLGRSSSLFSREAVWQLADGLEIESSEQYEIVRRQVLFGDVLFVTYHRQYGVAYLVGMGSISIVFVGLAMLIVAASGTAAWVAALIVLLLGMPAVLAFVLRLMFRIDIITVFGRRSKAAIRFGLRKRRARTMYGQICAAVRSAQERMARANAELPPPPPESLRPPEDLPDDRAG